MNTIVFFDTETGGLEPHHPTIQIAAISVQDWKEVDSFERKLCFNLDECEQEALNLNSYDPDVWESAAVDPVLALAQFSAFLRKHSTVQMTSKAGKPYKVAQLAGHNVSGFDFPRLQAAAKRHEFFLPARFHTLDTLQLALWKFHRSGILSSEGPADYKLGTLCQWYSVDVGDAHDALSDARSSMRLAQKLSGGAS